MKSDINDGRCVPLQKGSMIVDAGGTSMKWMLLGDREVLASGRVDGFNPKRHGWEVLSSRLEQIRADCPYDDWQVYYYGAGIRTEADRVQVSQAWQDLQVDRLVVSEVDSDLMLCVRSIQPVASAIIGILGTGSSVISVRGADISSRTSSLGYFIGDEGSGTDIGLRIIRARAEGALSQQVIMALDTYLGSDWPWILEDRVDSDKTLMTQRLNAVAHAAKSLFSHKEVSEIVRRALLDFIELRLEPEWTALKESSPSIYLFGGAAWAYPSEITSILEQRWGMRPIIHEGPLDRVRMLLASP